LFRFSSQIVEIELQKWDLRLSFHHLAFLAKSWELMLSSIFGDLPNEFS
jgi:hypothetical protein